MEGDLLEQTAAALGKSEWELFVEICELAKINDKRRDMLWDGWVWEDWIAPDVHKACYNICLNTILRRPN